MPPKGAAVPSPSPPPASANDAQDILTVVDMADTLDQIPNELTRVHSDLNELAAVLYATLITLESKLNTLVQWIQDPTIGQEQRFQLLQEIAEEAARYKLGGDDKIRVAGGACDGMMMHQHHINNLLESSTLLLSGPPSPYTQALTLANPQPLTTTRRGVLARAANSPFGGRGYAAASGAGDVSKERETPSKKKKSRVAQLGVKDDDEVSVAGSKKAPAKKRKLTNRAVSPTDSLASTSAFTGKPVEPRTARQLAAAANRVRKIEDDDSDMDEGGNGIGMQVTGSVDSGLDKNGLGLDVGGGGGAGAGAHSRDSSGPGRSANATPINGNGNGNGRNGRGRVSGQKRSRADDDEDDGGDEDESDAKPVKKAVAAKKTSTQVASHLAVERELELDNEGAEGEQDMTPYCICQRHSYGEMIGCDNDDCDFEWFHLACVGLTKTPEGEWTCPRCTEKLKRNPPKRKTSKAKARK